MNVANSARRISPVALLILLNAVTLLVLVTGAGIGWAQHTTQVSRLETNHRVEMSRSCLRMLGFLIRDHDGTRRIDHMHANAFKDWLPLAKTETLDDKAVRYLWAARDGDGMMWGWISVGEDQRIIDAQSGFEH